MSRNVTEQHEPGSDDLLADLGLLTAAEVRLRTVLSEDPVLYALLWLCRHWITCITCITVDGMAAVRWSRRPGTWSLRARFRPPNSPTTLLRRPSLRRARTLR